MRIFVGVVFGVLVGASSMHAVAKFPAAVPLNDEQKAKAAEAQARSAYNAKKEAFQLCASMQRVADRYLKDAKAKGKDMKPVDTPACQDPGPFQAATAPSAVVAAAPPKPAVAPTTKK